MARAKALIVWGTGSGVGKSLLTAGLLRHFRRLGLRAAPFKAQNMANHARVVAGGEMASAQWLQAQAAGAEPEVRMNPILIKPFGERGAQVVVWGKVDPRLSQLPWKERRPHLEAPIREALEGLLAEYDLLVLEGTGSGKSRFAQKLAGPFATLIATAEARDEEMAERIRRHQEERPPTWETLEEPLDLVGALGRARYPTVVVDCLTLWVANLLERGLDPVAEALGLLEAIRSAQKRVILVSNKVGMGIVPANPLARRYRDLLGAVNALLAREAEVYLMVAGRPLRLDASPREETP